MQRRGLLKCLAAGGVVLSVPLAVDVAHDSLTTLDADEPQPAEDNSPWSLVAPFSADMEVGLGWRVASISEVKRGAAVLTLRHQEGRQAQVHLCRRQGVPRGLAYTDKLDMFLMNDGDGQQQTHEDIGRVVKTVAAWVRRSEQTAGPVPTAPQLLTHSTRVRRYGPREILA